MKRLFRSSASVLAAGYIAFGIVALVLFAVPLWYAWQKTVEEGRAEILRADAQRLTEVFRRTGPSGLKAFVDERVSLQIAGERILLVADSSFHPIAGNLPQWPRGVPPQAGTYTVGLNLDGHLTRAVVVHATLDGGYNLLVGRDTARYAPVETDFWYGLAGAVVVLAMVGVLGGVLIRRALLLRIHGIQATVDAIMQGRLSHRLEMGLSGDELDTLSHTINGMLEQIEQLINGVRNVSNSIAHDLRTPLAELRSRLEELALTRPAPAETFAEIDAALADVDRVIAIFNALLRLAQIDTGMRRSGFVPLDAAKVASDAVEFYLPAAEMKGVSLVYRGNGPAPTSGDPVLLAQAVNNLIDNALKYVQPGGEVSVNAVSRDGAAVEIAVADNGPGVADIEKPKLVERFYRGDTSRGTPGVGLGLSLVDAVAKLHGGFLKLTDNNPGLCVHLIVTASGPHTAQTAS
jgi:signal transduction histidine kinase